MEDPRLHVLSTERLELRHLTTDDAGFILELTNDPDWLRYIGDRGIRTLDDARRYIETGPMEMYARLGFGLWAVEPRGGGAPVGICGLLRRDWLDDADIGFAFLPAFRGMGYAREAAAATLDYARTLGLNRVLAIVSPENEASLRLLVKLGMAFERRALPAADAAEVCVYGLALTPDGAANTSPAEPEIR
jgi:RimJ/RimL family protein N-acetyltransferase